MKKTSYREAKRKYREHMVKRWKIKAAVRNYHKLKYRGLIKFSPCEEMLKFRAYLKKKKIKWIDKTSELVFRTHFIYKRNFWSVINGHGTYGGIDMFTGENEGLLECLSGKNNGEPIGWLKAQDIIRMMR